MSARDKDKDKDRHKDTQTVSDAVGYGCPPQYTQFRKGQSGNPKGRPKGSKNLATVLEKALREKVMVNENGRRRTMTKKEATIKKLVNNALSGEHRAIAQVLDLCRALEGSNGLAAAAGASTLGEADHKVLQGIRQRLHNSILVAECSVPEVGGDQPDPE